MSDPNSNLLEPCFLGLNKLSSLSILNLIYLSNSCFLRYDMIIKSKNLVFTKIAIPILKLIYINTR